MDDGGFQQKRSREQSMNKIEIYGGSARQQSNT